MDELTYEVAGGTEHFISVEDRERDLLVGFCRLRFPGTPQRRNLRDAALVRELHVYGAQVPLETDGGDDWQHQGHGRALMRRAEALSREAGYEKLAVISGIGAREYYRTQLGYGRDGPYMVRTL